VRFQKAAQFGNTAFSLDADAYRKRIVLNTDAYALQRSDLNGFLFAEVGVEVSGMNLSVLSTLARLEMDPWQEAGRLAHLPRLAAVEGLARIIALMPASIWSLPDATIIAERLVLLLPARSSGGPSADLPLPPALDSRQPSQHGTAMLVLIGTALAAALMLSFAGQ
jgi:hypothetical protein